QPAYGTCRSLLDPTAGSCAPPARHSALPSSASSVLQSPHGRERDCRALAGNPGLSGDCLARRAPALPRGRGDCVPAAGGGWGTLHLALLEVAPGHPAGRFGVLVRGTGSDVYPDDGRLLDCFFP